MFCVCFKKNVLMFILSFFMFFIHSSLPVLASDAGGNFSRGPDMSINRMAHYSILLPDGKVLLLGGHGTNFVALNSAEVFDPNTNQFTLLTMNSPRDVPAIAKLQDGRYLIAGGAHDWGIAPGYNTAEIFNPANNSFTSIGTLNYARTSCGAATLTNGKVLIVGGWYSTNAGTYGEIFNPDTNSFSLTGALNTPRSWPYVIPAANQKAIVLGGTGVYGGSAIERIELYDSATNSFTIFRETLFEGETGWKVPYYQQLKVIDDFKLWNGNYLLLAYKTVENITEYTLFTFDPNTLQINKLNINLPDTSGDLAGLTLLGIDNNKKKAYLLGYLDTTPPPSTLRLYTVDLVNMTVNSPAGSYTVSPEDYYVSSFGYSILSDGRIFISGGTSRIDWYYNFYPVKYTLLINPEVTPSLKVLQPNGGQKWNAGSKYVIKWEAPLNSHKFTLRYSTNNKATWTDIATVLASNRCKSDGTKYTCTYGWTIPAQDGRKPQSFVRVGAIDSANQVIGTDDSDKAFVIEVLKLTSPNGGEKLKAGSTHTITWQTYALTKTVARVQLQYSTNKGQTWTNIATVTGNPGQYNWTVPNVSSTSCRVRVILRDSAGAVIASDVSDRVFTIGQ